MKLQIVVLKNMNREPILLSEYNVTPQQPAPAPGCTSCLRNSVTSAACLYAYDEPEGGLHLDVRCCLRANSTTNLYNALRYIESFKKIPADKIAQIIELIQKAK